MKLPNQPRVLAATYNPVSNTKMISFLVDFPTVLLAELRTHRILTQGSLYEHAELDNFNVSANSARAIPTNKYLQKVLDNPFVPIWSKQQPGMTGGHLEEFAERDATIHWNMTLANPDHSDITEQYKKLISLGIHKQNANRLIAPFAWTTCILSGTEWNNFFELRCSRYESADDNIHFSKKAYIKGTEYIYGHRPDLTLEEFKPEFWERVNKSSAQPEFQVIAEILYDLYQEVNWKESKYHIPFEHEIVDKYLYPISSQSSQEEVDEYYNSMMKISASMCAKLSYNTQNNEDTFEKHLERANLLIEHKHQEPFSHQAIVMNKNEYESFCKVEPYTERNKFKYDSLRTITCDDNRILQQGMYYGKCYNLTGFVSQRYILENY